MKGMGRGKEGKPEIHVHRGPHSTLTALGTLDKCSDLPEHRVLLESTLGLPSKTLLGLETTIKKERADDKGS